MTNYILTFVEGISYTHTRMHAHTDIQTCLHAIYKVAAERLGKHVHRQLLQLNLYMDYITLTCIYIYVCIIYSIQCMYIPSSVIIVDIVADGHRLCTALHTACSVSESSLSDIAHATG